VLRPDVAFLRQFDYVQVVEELFGRVVIHGNNAAACEKDILPVNPLAQLDDMPDVDDMAELMGVNDLQEVAGHSAPSRRRTLPT
jgi:hypothetical protein